MGTIARLAIAATTQGTDDVRLFTGFAQAAADHGPLGLYLVEFSGLPYNHGPLTSWMLVLFGHLAETGVPFPLMIRAPASLADLVTTVLVFELLRERRGDSVAAVAALVYAFAPVGLVVSGFHGNTDPVFVMLSLLALRCVLRGRPAMSGVALGLALSVKAVPVVLVPVLVVLAWRRGRGPLRRFLLGGAAVFAALWVPALVVARGDFVRSYLGYAGLDLRQWGFSEVFETLGVSGRTVVAVGNDLRFPLVLVVAILPALALSLARGRDVDEVALASLPLCLFLFTTPAFSMQYLAWALAASLLAAGLRAGAIYVATSSLFALVVYSGWSQAPPWRWDLASATPLPDVLVPLMFLTWIALGNCCFTAVWALASNRPTVSAPSRPDSTVERPFRAPF